MVEIERTKVYVTDGRRPLSITSKNTITKARLPDKSDTARGKRSDGPTCHYSKGAINPLDGPA